MSQSLDRGGSGNAEVSPKRVRRDPSDSVSERSDAATKAESTALALAKSPSPPPPSSHSDDLSAKKAATQQERKEHKHQQEEGENESEHSTDNSKAAQMGVGSSACKGLIGPGSNDDSNDADMPPRSLSTVTRLPFLPVFEDRPPFQTKKELCERDSSLLKALTHHRTPFAVIESLSEGLPVIYASGGFVAGMGMPVESIEGTGFAGLLKKGISASQSDVDRLSAAIQAQEVSVSLYNKIKLNSSQDHTRPFMRSKYQMSYARAYWPCPPVFYSRERPSVICVFPSACAQMYCVSIISCVGIR